MGRRHLGNLIENPAQRFRGADYVLKHRVTIDLFSQCEVFVARPLFSSDAIIDVSSRRIPTDQTSLLIAERFVTTQEPTVFSIRAQYSLLDFERNAASQTGISLIPYSLQIFGMKDSFTE